MTARSACETTSHGAARALPEVDGEPRLRVTVEVLGAVPGSQVRVRVAGTEGDAPVADGEVRIDRAVPGANLWWPRGYGEPALHELAIHFHDVDGRTLDITTRRIGFRSAEIRHTQDDDGIGCAIVVNGEPVLIRGSELDTGRRVPHRVGRVRYAERLAPAEFAGINLVRVWGGGIFESEDFYAECDERGILTWQDFLLASTAYSEDEPLRSEIEAESAEAIVRLAAHASLVVLNGNNENLWGREDWNWAKRLEDRTWGAGYYYDLFPKLVAVLAPHAPCTPGSLFSPEHGTHPNDSAQRTMQVWDVWNAQDWPHYRQHRPSFVSEFGWQGPPTWSTLRESVADDPLTPESPGMLVHQKALKGKEKLTDCLTTHLPLPLPLPQRHGPLEPDPVSRTAAGW